MKLLIFLALSVGLAYSVPIGCPENTEVHSISVKKFNHELGAWETVEIVKDQERINRIQQQQGDNLNFVNLEEGGAPQIGDISDYGLIPCDIPEIDAGDIFIPEPCIDYDIPTQTKVVDPCRSIADPCFPSRSRGLEPCIVEADGFKWRCTPKITRTPCPTPTIVDPCDPIILDPCEPEIFVDPCITVDQPCEPAILIDPCVPEINVEPCVSKFEMPCLSGFMDKLRDNVVSLRSGGGSSFASSFSSSSSSASSSSASGSSSSSFSSSWST